MELSIKLWTLPSVRRASPSFKEHLSQYYSYWRISSSTGLRSWFLHHDGLLLTLDGLRPSKEKSGRNSLTIIGQYIPMSPSVYLKREALKVDRQSLGVLSGETFFPSPGVLACLFHLSLYLCAKGGIQDNRVLTDSYVHPFQRGFLTNNILILEMTLALIKSKAISILSSYVRLAIYELRDEVRLTKMLSRLCN